MIGLNNFLTYYQRFFDIKWVRTKLLFIQKANNFFGLAAG